MKAVALAMRSLLPSGAERERERESGGTCKQYALGAKLHLQLRAEKNSITKEYTHSGSVFVGIPQSLIFMKMG